MRLVYDNTIWGFALFADNLVFECDKCGRLVSVTYTEKYFDSLTQEQVENFSC